MLKPQVNGDHRLI